MRSLAVLVTTLLAAPALAQTSSPAKPPPHTTPRLAPGQIGPNALRLGPRINLYDARVGLVVQGQLQSPAAVKVKAGAEPPTAILTVKIGADGHVTGASLAKKSGDPAFDSAALAAVQPFTKAGGKKLPVAKDEKIRNRAMTEGVRILLKHGAAPKKGAARKKSTLERLRAVRPGAAPVKTAPPKTAPQKKTEPQKPAEKTPAPEAPAPETPAPEGGK